MALNVKTKLFVILFFAGWAGVLSVLLIDFSALVRLIPAQPGNEIPTITPALKIVSLIQPSLLLAIAVVVGVFLAPRVGLAAPVANAIASRSSIGSALKPQLLPGLIGGIIGGTLILLIAASFKSYLTSTTLERIGQFTNLTPIAMRLLYGGITEELLLRWGFMTFLVWLGWRLLQKRKGRPGTMIFVGAIAVSAFVFGIGHLPVAFAILRELSIALTLFVISANSVFGLIGGYLYWKKGLESSMTAHAVTHIVLFIASSVGAYFH